MTNEEWIKSNIGTKNFDFAKWLVLYSSMFQQRGILKMRLWLKQEHKEDE